MKKMIYAAMIVLGTISFSACENKSNSSDSEADETVIKTDTTAVEIEQTVVESDTTKNTKTIETDSPNN
jgi:hypothetical protein